MNERDFPESLALAAEEGLLEQDWKWMIVIDENGFWRGRVLDCPGNRAALEAEGYDVSSGFASKQYVKKFHARQKGSERAKKQVFLRDYA